MNNISPNELIKHVRATNGAEVGVSSHTDDVTSDDIYVALENGVRYIKQALDKGVLAVVCQVGSGIPVELSQLGNVYEVDDLHSFAGDLLSEVYAQDIADVDLIGITGTNGKTSSSHFACQLFNLLDDKAGYIGTLGYGVIGGEFYASRNTTPDRITLYRYISLLKHMGCKKVVMEVSSHGITLGRIEGLEFHTAAFTNLSRDHLDFHQTMQAYEEAKLSFFDDYPIQKLVVNADDVVGQKLINKWSGKYGSDLSCYGNTASSISGYYRYLVDSRGDGVVITVSYRDKSYQLRINIKGQYNIENLLGAALICVASGYSFAQLEAITASVIPVPGRLECCSVAGGTNICVDYAHTSAGMEAVLTDVSLKLDNVSDTWCVFGCGGNRDKGKRQEMGRVASLNAEHVVVTDDNTRGEQSEAILCDIVKGIDVKCGLTICRDRKQAIKHVVESVGNDDLVLVLGKGNEEVLDYGSNKVPHRDIDVVSQWSGNA